MANLNLFKFPWPIPESALRLSIWKRFLSGWTLVAILVAVIWTFVIALSLIWNISQKKQTTIKLASIEARSHFNKDKAIRFWVASHRGVYVPASERTPPNPNLSHLPERDITTPLGKKLTLMNPAYIVFFTGKYFLCVL